MRRAQLLSLCGALALLSLSNGLNDAGGSQGLQNMVSGLDLSPTQIKRVMRAFDGELTKQRNERNVLLQDLRRAQEETRQAQAETQSCEAARSFLEKKLVRNSDENSHDLHAFQRLMAPQGPQGDHNTKSVGKHDVTVGEAGLGRSKTATSYVVSIGA